MLKHYQKQIYTIGFFSLADITGSQIKLSFYRFQSDIYSLGVVLIELLIKFGTDMERVRTIENARKGILPTILNKRSSKLIQR